MPITTQAFKGWLKSSNNVKLNLDASVLRLTREGFTNFASLSEFDEKSLENLPSVCENSIPVIKLDPTKSIASGANVSGANVS